MQLEWITQCMKQIFCKDIQKDSDMCHMMHVHINIIRVQQRETSKAKLDKQHKCKCKSKVKSINNVVRSSDNACSNFYIKKKKSKSMTF